MTRIIAGFAGSLTIEVPGVGTRPTSDRVREAIFSALNSRDVLEGARVLDLYAGSGALGLEAASRGAATVTLVESDARAAATCRKNTALVLRNAGVASGLTIDIVAVSVQSFLGRTTARAVTIAFLDPPYDLPEAELTRDLALLTATLAPDAVVVIERSSRSPEPIWPPGLALDKLKKYSDTAVWIARAEPTQQS
ncbi:MAG: RsmD family RNA methyltransferase [Microbacteriaceae bacterium]|nr:RsmD family RNA methyltransferase [Microbacteriaceae bacterium]